MADRDRASCPSSGGRLARVPPAAAVQRGAAPGPRRPSPRRATACGAPPRCLARDVHNAQQRAGIRIVERDGGAAPRVHGPLVVLRTGNLDAAAQGQGSSGSAGAHCGLGPVGARHEHHAFGTALQGRIAFHPEQPAHLVTHRNEQAAVVAGLDQELVDHGHDAGQGVLPPVFLELVACPGQGALRGCQGWPATWPTAARIPGSGCAQAGDASGRQRKCRRASSCSWAARACRWSSAAASLPAAGWIRFLIELPCRSAVQRV